MSTDLKRLLSDVAQLHEVVPLDSAALVAAAASQRRRQRRSVMTAGLLAIGAATWGLTALTQAVNREGSQAATVSEAGSPSPSRVADTNLQLSVDPSSGPAGTVIHISAGPCAIDVQDISISYAPDAREQSPGSGDPVVRAISYERDGTQLQATYTIRPSDVVGAKGAFSVQCGSSVAQVNFFAEAR